MPTPSLVLDAHGFPLVCLAGPVAVGLLPVLKVQFELAYGSPGGPDLLDVDACLRLNPRVSWRVSPPTPEAPYLTGLLPDEAHALAARLGGRVPTADEWREADAALDGAVTPELLRRLAAARGLHPAARALVRRSAATTWRGLSEGLLEWVDAAGLYGRPRPSYGLNLILNPRIHPPAVPRVAERHRATGVRLATTRPALGGRRP
jgi:hypothetical protein